MDQLLALYTANSNLIDTLGVNAILALGIAVTLNAGMLSLANAAFMGIGAYTAALLTVRAGWPLAPGLLAGALMAMAAALLLGLPVLRLRGVFLAIATIGFGEVVRIVGLNVEFTGGAQGLTGIPVRANILHTLVVLGLALAALARFQTSRAGLALAAIREDETAAATMGVNVTGHKVFAFVVGAGLSALAGGLSAHMSRIITPNDFGFPLATAVLMYAVIGGVGSLWGPILGAVLLTLLPELLRFLKDWRQVFSGAVLLLVILFLPGGLASLWPLLRSAFGRWGPPRSPVLAASVLPDGGAAKEDRVV
ncbi:MAG: branched-chain amino acid ABC transporter permease [Chloroflexi bacterium]|nr:branched-chain amino acid ABC transporter permease [Chloroflexota bacterium]